MGNFWMNFNAGQSFRLGFTLALLAALILFVTLGRKKNAGRAPDKLQGPPPVPENPEPEVEVLGEMEPEELAAVLAAAVAALGPGNRASRFVVRPFDPKGAEAWRNAGRLT